jgi:hypothetical protein
MFVKVAVFICLPIPTKVCYGVYYWNRQFPQVFHKDVSTCVGADIGRPAARNFKLNSTDLWYTTTRQDPALYYL